MIPLDLSLADVPSLPVHAARLLAKEGVKTVADVVWHLPFRHEDRRHMQAMAFQAGPLPSCHHVLVTKTGNKFFGGRSGVFEAVVRHATGLLGQQLTLKWWNMPFMSRVIAEGQELIVYGVIKDSKGRLSMSHPEYEIVKGGADDDAEQIHTGRITPIYRLKGAMTQKALRVAVWHVCQALPVSFVDDLLPTPSAEGEFAGQTRALALREVHFPSSMEKLEQSRRYLALEEFYGYQLRVARRKRRVIESGGRKQIGTGELLRDFFNELPFQLTTAQQRCLDEIHRDMASGAPMNRLLHGDVGSGKTVVAFAAMLRAVESGRQAVLMAPTQILAEQHARNARKWLEPLGLRVALRTGQTRQTSPTGQTEIVIGTHALLHDAELMHNTGIVVIDEQHKFGVAQRAKLIRKGDTPDVLVMTATPIPRTLTLTIYGDLEVSTIDQKPRDGVKIVTKVRPKTKLKDAAKFLREQIEEGRQGYIVYALIDESDKLEAGAATKGYEEWSKLLAPCEVGLLHGRMSAEEKEDVMKRFRAGKLDALVATTVIEVGIDVPNATVMFIHDAGRFGLAQLHQLRGRIGRGAHMSYCVLFVDDKDEENRQRLAIMEETSDGFQIAEEDLRRRGPGDVLGHAQSGQAPLLFGELLADTRLVRLARQLAEKTLDEDPQLLRPALATFRDEPVIAEKAQAMMQ
ncbi:MAG: ATP-dependent DNA helicase RecG [Prosthecobacter sp.]|uniref:ATP-dependent DNA helicase RecG n=1 Tax=Prosthecobacter sp. TaxID=1965333 RepID=UPI0038FD9949